MLNHVKKIIISEIIADLKYFICLREIAMTQNQSAPIQINVDSKGISYGILAELKAQNIVTEQNQKKLTGSVWGQIMNEVAKENSDNNKLYEKGSEFKSNFTNENEKTNHWKNNFVIAQAKTIEFSNKLWTSIKNIVTTAINKTSSTTGIQPSQALKETVTKSQEVLQNNLKNFNTWELSQIGLTPEKRDKILEYIQNVEFDNENFGAAQAKGNKILVSTNNQNPNDIANMITLLIHEANHCYENEQSKAKGKPRINTKEEEIACEQLAMLTTGLLIQKGALGEEYSNFGRYGHLTPNSPPQPAKNYAGTNDYKLFQHLNQWVNTNYTNLPDNINGDLTIEHMAQNGLTEEQKNNKLKIQKGDIIKIGDKEHKIGDNGIYLSGMGRTPILQLSQHNSTGGTTLYKNKMVLDNLQPTDAEKQFVQLDNSKQPTQTFEIIRNGKTIYTGKIYE